MLEIILIALLLLLSVGLIFANAFLFAFPELIVIVCLLFSISLFGHYIFRNRDRLKVWKVVISCLLVTIVGLLSIIGTIGNPYWNSITFRESYIPVDEETILTKDEALEDVNYVLDTLREVHPAFLDSDDKNVLSAYEKLITKLKQTESISIRDLYIEIQYMLSPLHDGHTTTQLNVENPHYYLYIWELQDMGYNLVEINSEALDTIIKKNLGLFCYDVEAWAENIFGNMISSKEMLEVLGYNTNTGIVFTYENNQGDRIEKVALEEDFILIDDYMAYYETRDAEKKSENNEDFVYYEYDQTNESMVLTLNSCKYNDKFKNTVKNMFEEIKENNINTVIVDLRENGGGNSLVSNEFIRYLDCDSYIEGGQAWRLGPILIPSSASTIVNKKFDDLTFSGDVYVLTSTNTFSSAMKFSQMIQANNLGVIVGQPPGNSPNGYGEVVRFCTPNGKFPLSVSSKVWYRIDENVVENIIVPDIECNPREALSIIYN